MACLGLDTLARGRPYPRAAGKKALGSSGRAKEDAENRMYVDFTGLWEANLPKCRFLGPPPKALLVKIEQSYPELLEEMVVTKHGGSKDRVVFKCWLNGEQDRNSLNGSPVRGNATWDGEELIIESRLQLGPRQMYFRDCWSLSSDGKTLTMEHRNDDLAGQLTILDRVG